MTYYRLIYRREEIPLDAAGATVGRSRTCRLIVDDVLVSREHAAFRFFGGSLWLEDLNSRNGVNVNGSRIAGRVRLRDGDIVTIGSHEVAVRASVSEPPMPTRRVQALVLDSDDTNATTGVDDLWEMIDRAAASGRDELAQRLLVDRLQHTVAGLHSGKLGAAALSVPTRYALRFAASTGKVTFIDWVFEAHQVAGAVLPAATVDELHVVTRKLRYVPGAVLRALVEGLTLRADELSATERFALQRTQGLLRTLLMARE